MKLILTVLLSIISTSFTYTQIAPFFYNEFSSSNWFEDLDNHYDIRNSLTTPFSEKLDSIITKGLETGNPNLKKAYYMYDKKEIIAFFNRQDWSWVPYAFSKYQYNNEGLMTEWSAHYWDGEVGSWDQPSYSKWVYKYNSLNKLESIELSNTQSSLPGIVNDIEIYDYEGDVITGANYFAVYSDGSLVNVQKSKFIYTNGKIDYAKRVQWRNEQWLPQDSIVYSYHPNGQLSKRDFYTFYVWQDDPIIYRESYHYNYKADGRLRNVNHFEGYDPITDAFINLDIIEHDHFPWGEGGSIITYNTNSDLDKAEFPYEGIEYDFNTDLLYSKVRYPRVSLYREMSNSWSYKISGINTYNGLDYSVDPPKPRISLYEDYYYSQLDGTAIEDVEADLGLQVCPNPASDYITIFKGDGDDIPGTFEIFDKGGQRVLEKAKVYSGDRVAISVLAEGIYFYRLSTGDKVYTGSFMKI